MKPNRTQSLVAQASTQITIDRGEVLFPEMIIFNGKIKFTIPKGAIYIENDSLGSARTMTVTPNNGNIQFDIVSLVEDTSSYQSQVSGTVKYHECKRVAKVQNIAITLGSFSSAPAAPVNPFSTGQISLSRGSNFTCGFGRCLNGRPSIGFASMAIKFNTDVARTSNVTVKNYWTALPVGYNFVVNIVYAGAQPNDTAAAIAGTIGTICTNTYQSSESRKCFNPNAGPTGMLFDGVDREFKVATVVAKGNEVVGQEIKLAVESK